MTETHIAIVGAAESDLGKVAPGMTPMDLAAQASVRALEDCGLALSDVDGLFCATAQARFGPMMLAEYLGIDPHYVDGTQIGGSSFVSHVGHAVAAINAGLCNVALVAYGSTQRSVSRAQASPPDFNAYETPYRPMMPVSGYAMAAARHMHEYGTTRAQLAEVAVAARRWAQLNPKAWDRDPLSIEDVLNSRPISDPLTLRDCCLSLDGGGAIVVTSMKRAADLKRKPVSVLGYGEAIGHASISNMADLTTTAAVRSGQRCFAQAGLRPEDVDVLSLYDAFTITPILFLEDLGFCKKGEGGAFVENGGIAPGGRLAVNTNGGGLSYNHPGMYGLLGIIECVRQLRGAVASRQVGSPEIALAHGNGGVLSSQCTLLLGAGT